MKDSKSKSRSISKKHITYEQLNISVTLIHSSYVIYKLSINLFTI